MRWQRIILTSCLLLCGMFGSMSMVNGAQVKSNSMEKWTCSCGAKELTGKFCPECGNMNPKYKAPVATTDIDPKPVTEIPPRMRMVDGPGMMNVNAWKHEVLNGSWITPEGNVTLKIKGFDFKVGAYCSGEADNFAWEKGRFYFNGWENSPRKEDCYNLVLSSPIIVKSSKGEELLTLTELWHEKISIYARVISAETKETKTIELRKPETIVE